MADDGDGADRISSLPNNVREHILMFLPLRDAARASILSTNWRNMWMDLPTLVFDENFGNQEENSVDKVMFDVCTVLLLHRGPLKEFSLSIPVLRNYPDQLDQILMFLKNNKRSIESLTIKEEGCYPYEKYKLSRRLVSFSQLKTLRLSDCKVKSTPDEFRGFVNLTVLGLKNVVFADSGDSSLVWRFAFSLLSYLTLDNCIVKTPSWNSSHSIVIEAPRLSCFHLAGEFARLKFKHTPVLQKATLDRKYYTPVAVNSAFLDIWGGLAAVESLSVSGRFCEYLEHSVEESNGLSPLEMLRHLTYRNVCLSRQSYVDTVLVMITSSPNLQRLEIIMEDNSGSVPNLSFHKGQTEFELSRLTRVEVKKLKGAEHELDFINWLLNSCPALDIMKIKMSSKLSDSEKIMILTELNGFARASPRAVIKIESPNQK